MKYLSFARTLAIEAATWAHIEAKLGALSAEEFKAFEDWMDSEPRESKKAPYSSMSGVAVIDLHGVVTKNGPGLCMEGFSTTQKAKAVKAAISDPAIHTLLLHISSPGGTVDGTGDLCDAVFEARGKKRVVAYASDLMASAAYWIGSQAEALYSNSTAQVGSIGVFQVVPDSSELYKAQGVKMNVVKSASGKAAGLPGTVVTEEQLADFKRSVQDIHELFVDAVARGRNMKARYQRNAPEGAKSVPDDGKCYIAEEALGLGLIDGIKSFDSLLLELQTNPRPVGRFAKAISKGSQNRESERILVPKLASSLKGARNMNSVLAKLGLAEDATDEQVAAAVEALKNKAESTESLRASFDEKLATFAASERAASAARTKEAIAQFEREQKATLILDKAVKALGTVTTAQTDAAKLLIAAAPEAFEAFVANLPRTAPVATVITEGGDQEAGDTGVVNLRDAGDRARLAKKAQLIQKENPKLNWDEAITQASASFRITNGAQERLSNER